MALAFSMGVPSPRMQLSSEIPAAAVLRICLSHLCPAMILVSTEESLRLVSHLNPMHHYKEAV